MKYKVTPTTEELVMRERDFIVSKSDVKGRFTYANRTFVEFAGYTEQELMGKQHNIIRHPDMPRAVYKLFWDTIQSGQEFWGYVKNMSKSGAFYWVIANVTPSVDMKGNIIGYYSVRRKPKAEGVRTSAALYKTMIEAEQRAGTQNAIQASQEILHNFLAKENTSYERFILGLEG